MEEESHGFLAVEKRDRYCDKVFGPLLSRFNPH